MNINNIEHENFFKGDDPSINYEELLKCYLSLPEDNPTPTEIMINEYIKEIPDDLDNDRDNQEDEDEEFEDIYPDYVGDKPRDSNDDFNCVQVDIEYVKTKLISYIEMTHTFYRSPSLLSLYCVQDTDGFKLIVDFTRIISFIDDHVLEKSLGKLVLLNFEGEYSISTLKKLYDKYYHVLNPLYFRTAHRYYLKKKMI